MSTHRFITLLRNKKNIMWIAPPIRSYGAAPLVYYTSTNIICTVFTGKCLLFSHCLLGVVGCSEGVSCTVHWGIQLILAYSWTRAVLHFEHGK